MSTEKLGTIADGSDSRYAADRASRGGRPWSKGAIDGTAAPVQCCSSTRRPEACMTTAPPFDLAAAHRFFSAQCFNDAWDLIGKADRTTGEDEYLISVCHASLWHWRCRADCTSRHLSIGYWQLSRVYALVGEAANARKYGELCRGVSSAEGPLLRGYAC